MLRCPVCKIKLKRTKYEGFNIHQCAKCRGQLVRRLRLGNIESSREKSDKELIREIAESVGDNADKLRCAKCYSTMEKRQKRIANSRFSIDRCNKCQLIWLDPGELARLQVIYQFSAKGIEQQAFKTRLENMTPAEKHEFEQRIANLPLKTPEVWSEHDWDTYDFLFDVW